MPQRVTTSTLDDAGTVRESPESLARSAGLDLNTYALARSIHSEAGTRTDREKSAVAWAIINQARYKGWSVMHLLGYVTGTGYTGTFGAQNQGRFASTRQDPKGDDVRVARQVLAGHLFDLTQGSRRWFNPAAQNALYAEGRPGYSRDAAGIMAKWQGEGWEPVYPYGIDHSRLVLFRKGDVTKAMGGSGILWLATGFGMMWWFTRRR